MHQEKHILEVLLFGLIFYRNYALHTFAKRHHVVSVLKLVFLLLYEYEAFKKFV